MNRRGVTTMDLITEKKFTALYVWLQSVAASVNTSESYCVLVVSDLN